MDGAKMADKERKTVVQDWRKVPADKRNQGVKSSGVCSNDEGEADGEEKWQTVRRATKTHSPEDREV
jgi:hypothetical protein